MTDSPQIAPPVWDSIPHAMASRPQWLLWRYEWGDGPKPRKIPYYTNGRRRLGEQGSARDRQHLATLTSAREHFIAALADRKRGYSGIGYAFLPDDNLIGVDLDAVIDENGELNPRANQIVDACASWTEISPSGTGLHVYLQGKTETHKVNAQDGRMGLEIFCGSQFFVVTGRTWPGAPADITPASDKLLARLHRTVEQLKEAAEPAEEAPARPAPAAAARGAPGARGAPDPGDRAQDMIAALGAISCAQLRYEDWLSVGMTLRAELGAGGLSHFDAWSATDADRYPGPAAIAKKWRSFKNAQGGDLVFKLARAAGWRPPRRAGRVGAVNQAKDRAGAIAAIRTKEEPENRPKGPGLGSEAAPLGAADITGFAADGKCVIRLMGGRQSEILDVVEAALAAAAVRLRLFVRGGRLVRLRLAREFESQMILRSPETLIAIDVEVPHLAELMGIIVHFQKFDARSGAWRDCDAPRKLAEALLARKFWSLPRLTGCCDAPTVTPEGRLIERPGYDHESGLFLDFEPIRGYQSPDKNATRESAENGVAILRDAISTFPFVSTHDESAALALLITPLVRRMLPSAPIFPVTAPTAGSGKSLYAEGCAVMATGKRPAVISMGVDDNETEKRIGGALNAGDLFLLIDNVSRPVGGDLMCQVSTQPSMRFRPLGGSEMRDVPCNATVVVTGNNLQAVGDLNRRIVPTRLDPRVERPERRTFDRDFLKFVTSNRGKLISAALSIPLAYLRAGAPAVEGHKPFGSFSEWDLMIRRPLMWLGMPDPLAAAEEMRESDQDLEVTRQLLSAWADAFGDSAKTASEVVDAGMDRFSGIDGGAAVRPELYDALQFVCSEKVNARRLGYWLKGHRDRIVDGMQLVHAGRDGHGKIAKWTVKKCG